MKHALLLITLLLSWTAAASRPTADTTVSIVNFYPGGTFYELEGHTALRLRFPDGKDLAVSWGLFDFNTEDFLYRFVKGETDYQCGMAPWGWFEDTYRAQGRRAVEHRLDFTPEQTRRLVELVADNLRPENRTYRYNYVKDNCATRPLRLVELAAGDSIKLGPAPAEAWPWPPVTFRNIMRHYHRDYPWYQFGIDLALGSGIDYPLTRREMSFAPAELDCQLREATAGGRKLVARTDVLLDFAPDNAVEPPTPWYLSPMTVCSLVLAAAIGLTVRDQWRRRVTRWFDSVLFGIFGLTGCVLTFLIFVSVHEATSPNWLYLWLNPLCLVPAVLIWLKSCRKAVMSYQIINFAALTAMCAAWWWLPQSTNPAFAPLILADAVRALSYICINRKKHVA